jgi:hypothetical protein
MQFVRIQPKPAGRSCRAQSGMLRFSGVTGKRCQPEAAQQSRFGLKPSLVEDDSRMAIPLQAHRTASDLWYNSKVLEAFTDPGDNQDNAVRHWEQGNTSHLGERRLFCSGQSRASKCDSVDRHEVILEFSKLRGVESSLGPVLLQPRFCWPTCLFAGR